MTSLEAPVGVGLLHNLGGHSQSSALAYPPWLLLSPRGPPVWAPARLGPTWTQWYGHGCARQSCYLTAPPPLLVPCAVHSMAVMHFLSCPHSAELVGVSVGKTDAKPASHTLSLFQRVKE